MKATDKKEIILIARCIGIENPGNERIDQQVKRIEELCGDFDHAYPTSTGIKDRIGSEICTGQWIEYPDKYFLNTTRQGLVYYCPNFAMFRIIEVRKRQSGKIEFLPMHFYNTNHHIQSKKPKIIDRPDMITDEVFKDVMNEIVYE